MNLHVVPDNVLINRFYDNLAELNALSTNRIVVRTNNATLQYVKRDIPFADVYSSQFSAIVGNTQQYDKVFIHQFAPLLYRWVATHNFKELNWMIWGADLYSLPHLNVLLYEPVTYRDYVRKHKSWQDFLYNLKVSFAHSPFRNKAYSKVRNVLTWMDSEYLFARKNLPALRARHQFFFYENQLPYQELNDCADTSDVFENELPLYILGNSSTPELNHVDAVLKMNEMKVRANLCVPISYGNATYARFLRKRLSCYRGGAIEFIDRYMDFSEYLQVLSKAQGLIMYNIRPQGYGNILMMMYLGKRVFLNGKNISIPDLRTNQFVSYSIDDIREHASIDKCNKNRRVISTVLAHEKLLKVYQELFA